MRRKELQLFENMLDKDRSEDEATGLDESTQDQEEEELQLFENMLDEDLPGDEPTELDETEQDQEEEDQLEDPNTIEEYKESPLVLKKPAAASSSQGPPLKKRRVQERKLCTNKSCVYSRKSPGSRCHVAKPGLCVWCDPQKLQMALNTEAGRHNIRSSLNKFVGHPAVEAAAKANLPDDFQRTSETQRHPVCSNPRCCFSPRKPWEPRRVTSQGTLCSFCDPQRLQELETTNSNAILYNLDCFQKFHVDIRAAAWARLTTEFTKGHATYTDWLEARTMQRQFAKQEDSERRHMRRAELGEGNNRQFQEQPGLRESRWLLPGRHQREKVGGLGYLATHGLTIQHYQEAFPHIQFYKGEEFLWCDVLPLSTLTGYKGSENEGVEFREFLRRNFVQIRTATDYDYLSKLATALQKPTWMRIPHYDAPLRVSEGAAMMLEDHRRMDRIIQPHIYLRGELYHKTVPHKPGLPQRLKIAMRDGFRRTYSLVLPCQHKVHTSLGALRPCNQCKGLIADGKMEEVLARLRSTRVQSRSPTEQELFDACSLTSRGYAETHTGTRLRYQSVHFYRNDENIERAVERDAMAYAPPRSIEERTYMFEEDVRLRYNLHLLSQPAVVHEDLKGLHEFLSK